MEGVDDIDFMESPLANGKGGRRAALFLVGMQRFSVVAAVIITVVITVVIAGVVSEVEQIKEVADGRGIERHIRVAFLGDGVREIIAAAMGERLQIPIPLDELENRDVVGVSVADVAAPAER
jgi:hypothetical protein